MKLEAQMSIPHLFRCPISLDLFTDPVTLCTGQTYDRPFIEKWLASGNVTCPVTMQKLNDLSMVPNHTLSHLIHQWLSQMAQKISSPSLPRPEDRDHDDEFLAELKQTLESEEPIWDEKLLALKQVNALSLVLPNRENESLVKLGFFPLLIRLALEGGISNQRHQRSELVEAALSSALKILPFCELGCLNMIKEEPKFAAFTNMFEQGTSAVKISLCHLLETIILSPQTKELCTMISNSTYILQSVINLVKLNHDQDDYDDDDESNVIMVSEAGVKAILALCSMDAGNHHQQPIIFKKLVEIGAIQALIRCIGRALRPESRLLVSQVPHALEAVEILLKAEGGKEALLSEPNGVRALVKMVFRVSDHQGSEKAVNCLMGLCCDSTEAREEAIRGGVLTQLLLLIQSQCSGRTKTRARMLLKLLRSMWAKDPIRKHVVV